MIMTNSNTTLLTVSFVQMLEAYRFPHSKRYLVMEGDQLGGMIVEDSAPTQFLVFWFLVSGMAMSPSDAGDVLINGNSIARMEIGSSYTICRRCG